MQITLKLASPFVRVMNVEKDSIRFRLTEDATVGMLVDALKRTYPALGNEPLFDQAMVFINGNNINRQQDTETLLREGDSVYMLPVFAGG
ncbi:hypothetical protein DSCO28_15840 [Desulfosarcina ovata subsp. sediminis]|uniref:Molybdopterin synthase sulfur carrier subunit n=1 Tax=Desulfosarcina ovata subsp. sediminis TaxID=885957 RepID=A0A5K7ZFT0_9BACT|nr:MoaD/ThiS family protein [Desulfosarcina ovata]BBO81018.1 hypothetical protein DSCO28_15840 [Desulfosarcina ovata subsp. sediminis]